VLVMSKPQQSGFGGRPATPPPTAPKLTDAEQRAMGDYADVFSQMFRDGFFKPQGLWCAAHGVEYQVHINHEEAEMQLVRSQGEFLRDMKYVEVPGIDAIWHQIWTDTITDYPRLASSAAHIYGHPRSFTESFAAYRPEPDVTMARYILNEQMVRGINVIETMMFAATRPAGAPPEPQTARCNYCGCRRNYSTCASASSSRRRAVESDARSRLASAHGLRPSPQLCDEHGTACGKRCAVHPFQFDVAGRFGRRHRVCGD
jgi:hypothetical protein